MAKIRNFDSFRGYSHISAPVKVKFGTGSAVPNFTFIGATCRPCGMKNPFSDHWIKQYRYGCASRRPAGNNAGVDATHITQRLIYKTAVRLDNIGIYTGRRPLMGRLLHLVQRGG